jgi:hypothetical protein
MLCQRVCCAKGYAVPKGMLPGHSTQRHLKDSNDRFDYGRHMGQKCIMFRRQQGTLRGHGMDRHPEKTAVGKVAHVEGDTGTDSTAKAAAAGAPPQHHQPMHGCTGSAPCVSSRR